MGAAEAIARVNSSSTGIGCFTGAAGFGTGADTTDAGFWTSILAGGAGVVQTTAFLTGAGAVLLCSTVGGWIDNLTGTG